MIGASVMKELGSTMKIFASISFKGKPMAIPSINLYINFTVKNKVLIFYA